MVTCIHSSYYNYKVTDMSLVTVIGLLLSLVVEIVVVILDTDSVLLKEVDTVLSNVDVLGDVSIDGDGDGDGGKVTDMSLVTVIGLLLSLVVEIVVVTLDTDSVLLKEVDTVLSNVDVLGDVSIDGDGDGDGGKVTDMSLVTVIGLLLSLVVEIAVVILDTYSVLLKEVDTVLSNVDVLGDVSIDGDGDGDIVKVTDMSLVTVIGLLLLLVVEIAVVILDTDAVMLNEVNTVLSNVDVLGDVSINCDGGATGLVVAGVSMPGEKVDISSVTVNASIFVCTSVECNTVVCSVLAI